MARDMRRAFYRPSQASKKIILLVFNFLIPLKSRMGLAKKENEKILLKHYRSHDD